MNVVKSILIWLLRAICVLAVSALVYLATLSMTLLDRNDVKQWLGASGAYNSSLIETLFTTQSGETNPTESDQTLITNEAIKNAMVQTFTPRFIRFGFETVVDRSYDWVEGKRAEFSFSIPINTKRETFIAELIKQVEPRVAALPLCSNIFQQSICRPATLPVSTFTQQIVADSLGGSDFLTTPLTEASFSSAASQSTTNLTRLPLLRSWLSLLIYIVPVVFGVCALGGILLSTRGTRLRFIIKIARAVFSNMLLSTGLAAIILIIYYSQGGLPVERLLDPSNPLTPLIARFLTQMILDFAWTLLIVAGSIFILSIGVWIATTRLNKRHRQPMPQGIMQEIPPSAP